MPTPMGNTYIYGVRGRPARLIKGGLMENKPKRTRAKTTKIVKTGMDEIKRIVLIGAVANAIMIAGALMYIIHVVK